MDWLNHVVAPLLVASATGAFGYVFAKLQAARKQRKSLNDAPRKYVAHLDRLIQRAANGDQRDVIVGARAIVATRDSMRNSLTAVAQYLNSEIDRLATQLGVDESSRFQRGQTVSDRLELPDATSVLETLRVLQEMWPARRALVEVEVRKLIAELGIDVSVLDERENV